MIINFLQFIKKQSLCNRLAKKDCLFLVENLKTFKKHLTLAKKKLEPNNLSKQDKIKTFLISENNPILYAFAQDFSARTDIFGNHLFVFDNKKNELLRNQFLVHKIKGIKDKDFYLDLFLELIKNDFPALWTQYLFFKKRLDMVLDMRLYGSELEGLCDKLSNVEHGCDFSVNWQKTDKEKLYIEFIDECRLSSELNLSEQENFAQFFAYSFFEKSLFVSDWQALAINKFSQVFYLDFDYIYQASETLKSYAKEYFLTNKAPASLEELKLHRALMLLEKYCHNIDIKPIFAPYLEQSFNIKKDSHRESFLLKLLSEQDLAIGMVDGESGLSLNEFSYLFAQKNSMAQKKFNRRTYIYILVLIIIIFILMHMT